MIKLTLPIYYTQEFKTKKSKTFLVGMNWYRNAHYILSNQVKLHYHRLILQEIMLTKPLKEITLNYKIYLKNTASDGPNVRSVIEKFALDGLIKAGVIKDDNVKIVKGDTSEYFIDKENPRCEIEIKELTNK